MNTNCSDLRGFGRPKTTSTPLHSRDWPVLTSTKSALKRYSLADNGVNLSPCKEMTKHTSGQKIYNVPAAESPSSRYSNHINTHIDSRSPGYTGRIVQYNEEREKSSPICQSRYDRPGIFPIVHFFKEDLPVLKRKRNQVTVRMHSSDLSKYNTAEQNHMLLERIIQSSSGNKNTASHKNEVNTKSVLDALKEISRKRIHPSEEEVILNEDGKRRRTDYVNGTSLKKTTKQSVSQLEDSFSVRNLNSKYCSMDELMASHSSMDGQQVEILKPEKNNGHVNSVSISKETERSKLVDVETQTIALPVETIAKPAIDPVIVEKKNENVTSTIQEVHYKKNSPVKVFDEKPLETMRKNRLSVLMGTVNEGKVTKNEDSERKLDSTEKSEEKSPTEKPLVSILSGSTKSPHKTNKHVTFNIPDTTESAVVVTTANTSPSVAFSSPNLRNGNYMLTKTSAALVTPIVTSSIIKLSPTSKQEVTKENQIALPPTLVSTTSEPKSNSGSLIPFKSTLPTSDMFLATKEQPSRDEFAPKLNDKPTPPTSTFNFGAKFGNNSEEKTPDAVVSTTNNSTSNIGAIVQNNVAFSRNTTYPNFSFGDKTTNADPSKINTANSKGGFKFDLKQTAPKPAVTASFSFVQPLSAPTFMTNKPETSQKSEVVSNVSAVNSVVFSQPTTSANANLKGNFNFFGMPPTATSTTLSNIQNSFPMSSGGFSSGASPSFNTSIATNKNPYATSTIVTSAPNVGINMPGSNPRIDGTNPLIANSTLKPNSTTSASVPTFNTSLNTNKSSSFTFVSNNNLTTFAPTFTSTAPSIFGSNTKPAFGTITTTASLMFRSANLSAIETPVAAPAPPGLNVQPNTSFGGSVSTVFDKPITSFSSSNSSFTPMFNTTIAATSTNNTLSFGMTSTPSFNINNNTTTFNTSSLPNFGNTAPTKPMFGTSIAPFGGAVTTAAAPTFCSSTVQTFGTPNTFATAGTTVSNIFGNTGNFGTTVTTAASTFGSNTTSNFGTSNFGTNQNSGFAGNSTNEFRNNPAPSFGNTSNLPFGVATTATDFGTTNSFNQSNNAFAPAFGGTGSFEKSAGGNNFQLTPFANTNNSFGCGNFPANPPTTQGEVFTFGVNSSVKPGVFSFGASEPPKPTFNFSAKNNSNIFGVGNKGFGDNTAAFGTSATPQFNIQQSPTSMFNIGTGSSTPSRSRTQLKAKRRT